MALKKERKEEMVSSFSDIIKGAKSVVFTKFDKLTVGKDQELRRSLKDNGVSYKVVKKTLLKRALNDSGLEGTMPSLDGEVSIAYGDDLLSPARGVYDFQKSNKDIVSLLGGIFDGKFMDMAQMTEVASIPALPVLRGKFVNIINSPISKFVIALNEIAKGKN